ncbi:ABC transporter substrate-binding protein [Nocardia inohanensis]|uniref:ABC transporter substrate-binding protein n=1 Tax=Nocardia inohanensis TaxID=209246 RepID=UPI00082B99DC|nr:iron-siderophore ABC transporter substrate-binding protein [Nocardia inohanensis]
MTVLRIHPLRRLLSMAAILLGVIATAACGSGASSGYGETRTESAGFPLTVQHAMGSTDIQAPPRRIVALDLTFVDAALALGGNVVGYTTIAGSGDGLPAYFGEDAAKFAPDAVAVGTLEEPSLEKIAALRPDVILSAKVRHEKLYKQLSAIAPTVFSATTGADWKNNLRLTGTVLGAETKAAEQIAAFEQRAGQIGDEVRRTRGGNPTVSVVRFVDGPTRIYKEATYIGVIMKDLRFDRPAAARGSGFSTEISDEQIALMDADDIFITRYADKGGLSQQTEEKFKANPLWGKLHGAIHEVDDLTWMSAVGLYGARSVLDDVAAVYHVDRRR